MLHLIIGSESRGNYTRRFMLAVASFLLASAPVVGFSQDADDEKKPAEPEDITLETKDFVQLKCTYYPGSNGKSTVPIMIVHGWEENRGQYDALALYLQSKEGGGHAVIVPDLRGHGESMTRKLPNGEQPELDPKRFRLQDFAAMIQMDLEAVKSHLMKENNAGKLNIELLTVVGSEVGSLLALNFAAQDWSWQQLSTMKQGQDVKALVLISPLQRFKGLNATNALRHKVVSQHLSMLILSGTQDRESHNSAERIESQIKKYHPDPPAEELREKKDLFMGELKTSLSGSQLVSAPGLNVAGMIKTFIDLRLVAKSDDFKWTDRTSPFGK